MMLVYDGHQVTTANSAKDALAIFERGKFDIVVTDYAMPVMKGDALTVAIKALAPDQPVIMITAYAEMLQGSGRGFAGVNCMISKPFQLHELRSAIAKVGQDQTEPA
jgi:CheY-like chemotaxis protein